MPYHIHCSALPAFFATNIWKFNQFLLFSRSTASTGGIKVTWWALLSLFLDRFLSYFQGINRNKMPFCVVNKLHFHLGFHRKNVRGSRRRVVLGPFQGNSGDLGCFSGRWVKISRYRGNGNSTFCSHWYPENMREIGQNLSYFLRYRRWKSIRNPGTPCSTNTTHLMQP